MKTRVFYSLSKVPPIKESAVLVQIFTSIFDKKEINNIVNSIKSRIPNANIIGATAGDKIIKGKITKYESIFIITLFSKSILKTLYISNSDNLRNDINTKSALLLEQNTNLSLPRTAIALCEGIFINGEDVVNGISDALPGIKISGGLASDNMQFKKTFVFTEDSIGDGVSIVFLFSDELHSFNTDRLNWFGLGPKLKITKSVKNIVYEINDKPILDMYRYYLGDIIANTIHELPFEFPLIISNSSKKPIARAMLSMNKDNSFKFSGVLPEGTTVQFGFADGQEMTLTDKQAVNYENPADIIFIYSSVVRELLVGRDIENETMNFQRYANAHGFFTYGEFHYSNKEKRNIFLNNSTTALFLSESGKIKENIKRFKPKPHRETLRNIALSCFAYRLSEDFNVDDIPENF